MSTFSSTLVAAAICPPVSRKQEYLVGLFAKRFGKETEDLIGDVGESFDGQHRAVLDVIDRNSERYELNKDVYAQTMRGLFLTVMPNGLMIGRKEIEAYLAEAERELQKKELVCRTRSLVVKQMLQRIKNATPSELNLLNRRIVEMKVFQIIQVARAAVEQKADEMGLSIIEYEDLFLRQSDLAVEIAHRVKNEAKEQLPQ